MKLAVLGVVTVGIGIALSSPGLAIIGAFWVLMGFVAREYRNRLEQQTPTTEAAGSAPKRTSKPAVDGRTFAIGTVLWLLIGVPSVAVGVFEIGIGAEHSEWRWLPIAVGGFALVIGVLGGLLYGAGSVALAADPGGSADKPATLWIQKVTETGTYVNERPRLEFEFLVEPDASTGLTSYEATKKATVPYTAMGSLRVGDGFRATVVGPEKPAAMDIDWGSPVPGPGSQDNAPATGVEPASGDLSERLDELDRLHRDAKITDEEYRAQRERILGSL